MNSDYDSIKIEEAVAPAAPRRSATVSELYEHLVGLHQWCVAMKRVFLEWQPTLAPMLPTLPPIAPASSHAAQAVTVHYEQYQSVRWVREKFDLLLREFESDWMGQSALSHRLMLLAAACQYMNLAFASIEYREHIRAQQLQNELQNGLSGVIIGIVTAAPGVPRTDGTSSPPNGDSTRDVPPPKQAREEGQQPPDGGAGLWS